MSRTVHPTPAHHRVRASVTVAAVCAALALGIATPATAAPTTTQPSPPASAAQSALSLATPSAASGPDVFALISQANAALRALGIQSFLNPSVSFNCVTPTASNPLGLAGAVGGAVAGPWSAPGLALPTIPLLNIDPNVVKDGQTLYGFVPAGITPTGGATTGMQVAWFNISTGKGGFAAMRSAGATLVDTWLAAVPAGPLKDLAATALGNLVTTLIPPGTRLAPVDTGKGTVLSAVFGTVANGSRSCFFLPMVGITSV
ncbi:hypothetical protein [Williamsia sp. CHRR-6]|uniref:hypothetical protein n=1 Tax=Williamsia sp. CHRR-6 TaxID=2835871 RepID=UPI001BDAB213|nr:hypothetical protein [Williamsia sp. CHRR-6]MBT0565541.1 hypothetical protein [Williamsia sp. CHRR-6]